METLAPAAAYRHQRLHVSTARPTEFLDITAHVQALVAETGIHTGFANVQSLHTTTALVLNEHEPLLLADFTTLFQQIAPAARGYQHDDLRRRTVNLAPDERSNGHAHCRALLLCPSVCLNITGGRLQLGTWQRLFLVELDGPRPRDFSVMLMGEGTR